MLHKMLCATALAVICSATAYAADDEYVRVDMRGTLRSALGYGNTRSFWVEVDGDRYYLRLSEAKNDAEQNG